MTLANATRDAAAPGMMMMMKKRGIGRSGRCGRPGAGARRGNDAVARAGKRPAPGDRLYNFSAGPATLPLDVLEEVQGDVVNYKGSGMSVLEMSHRGKDYMEIAARAESDLRELVGIPDNYKVLFLQGGASSMMASNCHNLATATDSADYVLTGAWSVKAQKEGAKLLKNANVCASSKEQNFTTIPDVKDWNLTEGSKFVHICSNETIGGVEFKEVPDVGDRVLVADMSSNYLSKPIEVEKYGVIYGGVQKNIGPAGMGICIVRDDLIGNARADTPSMFDYKIMADNDSMYNTPPCFTWYISGLVFAKLLKDGGLAAVEQRNIEKANVLYNAIDNSDGYYVSPVDKRYRSMMNVPFTLAGGADLEKEFLAEAKAEGFEALKGHRSVGGARASIYNAMPKEGVEALASFMKDFKARNA